LTFTFSHPVKKSYVFELVIKIPAFLFGTILAK
jgi:hypothetical protein